MSDDSAKGRGRPSEFTEEIADQICERLAGGESLRSICESPGFPRQPTVFRWLSKNEDFRARYARARESQADAIADEILDIADEKCTTTRINDEDVEIVFDSTAVQRNKLRIDARRWLAGKLRPKVYGDKIEHDVQGEVNHSVTLEIGFVKPKDRD